MNKKNIFCLRGKPAEWICLLLNSLRFYYTFIEQNKEHQSCKDGQCVAGDLQF